MVAKCCKATLRLRGALGGQAHRERGQVMFLITCCKARPHQTTISAMVPVSVWLSAIVDRRRTLCPHHSLRSDNTLITCPCEVRRHRAKVEWRGRKADAQAPIRTFSTHIRKPTVIRHVLELTHEGRRIKV